MMTNKKVTIRSFFIGIIFILIYNAPFIHERFIPLQQWSVYKEYYKNHKIILNKYDIKATALIKSLKNKEITVDQFILETEQNKVSKKEDLKNYFVNKKKLKKEFSFLGYSSFRIFIYELGSNIFSLFSSILLLIFVFNPKHIKSFKKFYIISISGLIYVSLFWFFHTLLTKTDFSGKYYIASEVILSILALSLIFIFVSLFSKAENKLKKKIRSLISFIVYSRENVITKIVNNKSDIQPIIDDHEIKMWDTLKDVAE